MPMNHLQAALALALLGLPPVASAHGDALSGTEVAAKKEQREWGMAGDPASPVRTVEIDMSDRMRFSPALIEARQGETIRFAVRNGGKLMHEMVIGTRKELDEHAALMARFPNMEHDEPYMTHVRPGKHGQMVWTFNRAGDFEFGCLIPGHYQAGMVGKIRVAAR